MSEPQNGVEAILLGTAQDGGVPQTGCTCPRCTAAIADPARRRLVSCLGLVDHTSQEYWIVDATPDFREQLQLLGRLFPTYALSGIALTHAHSGHYTGLVHLGREAWDIRGLPVFASAQMTEFLRTNAPWSQLIQLGNVTLWEVAPGKVVRLTPMLKIVPHQVPHRDEFSDTLAFEVEGPSARLFYCPDIDSWDVWDQDLRSFVEGMDAALLDGTFFSEGELPGRNLAEIPHPLITDTARRLSGVDCDVRLIHLNHSNPLHDAGSERAWLAGQGLGVGALGDRWVLG
jgi:pyrroloquinoline quinone biosynthesis protein B